MKEVLLELLRVQYAPNAPKGRRSILYMIIDKGHKDKGHKVLCPLSEELRVDPQHDYVDPADDTEYVSVVSFQRLV